ncbi:hypothetical protein Tco_0440092 [Tanacetum coccineum]
MKSAKDVTEEEAAEYEKEKEELRADESSSYHGDTQAFLRRLDRQDLNDLYRLVQERFQDHPLEGHDLLLWEDLRMIFDPDEKDELWMNQLDWKLLRWKLYGSCGVHTLFMDGTPMEINMLVEKKYPLIKELLEKMLNLSVDTPLISPFPYSDNDFDDEEVLNELCEYENTGTLHQERIINSFDGDDLAFECMIGFTKFTAYLDPFLPMNIISRKAYNTIMVDRLEGTRKNLIATIRDVYVFVGSFTYITDFVVLEDIEEFIMSDMAEVLMGRSFRKNTKLKYDIAKGLVSFTKIFDTYTYRMPRTIPRLKNFNWSKVPPLLELSQNDLMNRIRYSYEKNKFMYKNCLNLGPEYQVDGSMKEWLLRGHVSIHETTLYLMRRSLEVLRKFHWMILGGRFNQLSHVSSPLLSKPGEY